MPAATANTVQVDVIQRQAAQFGEPDPGVQEHGHDGGVAAVLERQALAHLQQQWSGPR